METGLKRPSVKRQLEPLRNTGVVFGEDAGFEMLRPEEGGLVFLWTSGKSGAKLTASRNG